MTDAEILRFVKDLVARATPKAFAHFGGKVKIPNPKVLIVRNRARGGMAYGDHTFEVTAEYVRIDIREFENTIIHEFAHNVVSAARKQLSLSDEQKYSRDWRGHGKQWKELMLALGEEPTRCMKGPPPDSVLTWKASCGCGTKKITGRKAGFMRKTGYQGASMYSYTCRKCGKQERLLGRT